LERPTRVDVAVPQVVLDYDWRKDGKVFDCTRTRKLLSEKQAEMTPSKSKMTMSAKLSSLSNSMTMPTRHATPNYMPQYKKLETGLNTGALEIAKYYNNLVAME
jgi:hypothetical protein